LCASINSIEDYEELCAYYFEEELTFGRVVAFELFTAQLVKMKPFLKEKINYFNQYSCLARYIYDVNHRKYCFCDSCLLLRGAK